MDATTKEKLAALYELLKRSHDIEDGAEGPRANWAMRCTVSIDDEFDPAMRRGRPVDLPGLLAQLEVDLQELPESLDVSAELKLLAEVRATLPACVWCGEPGEVRLKAAVSEAPTCAECSTRCVYCHGCGGVTDSETEACSDCEGRWDAAKTARYERKHGVGREDYAKEPQP